MFYIIFKTDSLEVTLKNGSFKNYGPKEMLRIEGLLSSVLSCATSISFLIQKNIFL